MLVCHNRCRHDAYGVSTYMADIKAEASYARNRQDEQEQQETKLLKTERPDTSKRAFEISRFLDPHRDCGGLKW